MDAILSDILDRLDQIEIILAARSGSSHWMTTREAADFLRCSRSKIEQLTMQGLLPYKQLDPTPTSERPYYQSLRSEKRRDPGSSYSPRLYSRRFLTAYLVVRRNPLKRPLSTKEKREVEELL